MARLTRREVADFGRRGAKDRKYLDRSADAYEVSDRHQPATDERARQWMIDKWLGRALGHDPVKLQTYHLMELHAVHGWSIEELAEKIGTTPNALYLRFSKLRKELAPKVKLMDRENVRLVVLFFLWGGLAALLVVLAFVVFRRLSPHPQRLPPTPEPRPVPTVTASGGPPAPSFDQALPPNDVPPGPPAGTAKPGGE